MIDEKKKMTAQDLSVGADDGQSISKNSDISILLLQQKIGKRRMEEGTGNGRGMML